MGGSADDAADYKDLRDGTGGAAAGAEFEKSLVALGAEELHRFAPAHRSGDLRFERAPDFRRVGDRAGGDIRDDRNGRGGDGSGGEFRGQCLLGEAHETAVVGAGDLQRFGEADALVVGHQFVMQIDRLRQAEQGLQQAVDMTGFEQVRAARHDADADLPARGALELVDPSAPLVDAGRPPTAAVVTEGPLVPQHHRPTGPALVERMPNLTLPEKDTPAWRRSFTRYEAIAALRNAIVASELPGVTRLS